MVFKKSAPVALTVMFPVVPDRVIPEPAAKLTTPVLVTTKPASGPVLVKPVMLTPAPAVGATEVITRLLLSNNFLTI